MNLTKTSSLNTNSLYSNKNIFDHQNNSQNDLTAKSFGSKTIDKIVRGLVNLQNRSLIHSTTDVCEALDYAQQILCETKNEDSIAITITTNSKSDKVSLSLKIKNNEIESNFNFPTTNSTLDAITIKRMGLIEMVSNNLTNIANISQNMDKSPVPAA